MTLIKKGLYLFIALFFVYGGYFLTQTPKSSPQQQHVLGVADNLLLLRQPDSGVKPIITAIREAARSIDVEVYLLSDKDVVASLIGACQRGVAVRVMLEEHPFGGGNINQKTKQQLDTSCVKAQWTNPTFPLTHEKTIVIDNALVFILNQNLTHASFTSNREYDIEDGNKEDVREVEKIFSADWNRSSFLQTDKNLLISPLSSRSTMTSLIQSASSTLDIEMEVIDDAEMVSLLAKKAKQIQIRIILPSLTKVPSNKTIANTLEQSGISVRFLENPYVHAKLILADSKKMYVGSVNLTTQSMDSNREVGIIVLQPDVVVSAQQSFQSDWGSALVK